MDWILQRNWDFPAVIAVLIGLWLVAVIVLWHTEDSKFDMRHVLIDACTNRVSLHKLGQFIALVVSTVVLWYEMMHGRLSEWLFTGYMVTWAGALLARRWIDKNSNVKPDKMKPDESDPLALDEPEPCAPSVFEEAPPSGKAKK